MLGWILIVVGVVDLIIGNVVVAPRVPLGNRAIVTLALTGSASTFIVVGLLFVTHVLHSPF